MKLKAIILSGLFFIPLFSCENREETTIVDIETELVAEISITTELTNSVNLKSQTNDEEFTFDGTGIFCLAQNVDFNKPMCIIKNIKPGKGCKIVFQDLEKAGNILSMRLSWDAKSNNETDFDMQDEIEITLNPLIQNDGNWEMNLTDNNIEPLVSCIDSNPTCLYRVDIVGTADFILPANALIKIPVSAENHVNSISFDIF